MQSLWEGATSGTRVVQLSEPEEMTHMLRLFESVAKEQGWQPGEALHLWMSQSVYFAAQVSEPLEPDRQDQFIGGLQLVLPDASGLLPCHSLWPEVSVNPSSGSQARMRQSRTAHIAMLAVEAPFRGQSLLFWSLAVEMWRYCVAENIATLWIEVTPRVLPLYRRLGWPLCIQGERRIHWGEECYLCTLGIPEVAQAILQRAEHSPYYRQIIAQAFRMTLPSEEVNGDRSTPEEVTPLPTAV